MSPVEFKDLPGAILAFKNSYFYLYATKIKLKEVTLEKPEGKLISYEDYKAMYGKPRF